MIFHGRGTWNGFLREMEFGAVLSATSARGMKALPARTETRRELVKTSDALSQPQTLVEIRKMARQGRVFTDEEVRKIVWLLSATDLTMKNIAVRMRCSHSAVVAINRKSQVRDYAGRRTSWMEIKTTCA